MYRLAIYSFSLSQNKIYKWCSLEQLETVSVFLNNKNILILKVIKDTYEQLNPVFKTKESLVTIVASK